MNMLKKQRDYANDYVVTEELSASGKLKKSVVYKGKHYAFKLEDAKFKRLKLLYSALITGIAALFVWMGLSGSTALGASGSQACAYVLLPYVVMLLPVGMCAAKTFCIAFHKNRFEYAQYDKYIRGLRTYTLVMTVTGALCTLGSVLRIVLENAGVAGDLIFTLCAAGCTLLSGLYLSEQSKNRCEVCDEQDAH